MLHDEHPDVKVTIITVVYNAVDKIGPTIESVLAQNYGNVEYIVIDGASADGTVEVINRYRDRIDAFVSKRDKGIYDALNKGVDLATGDWIGIMNAGDVFASNDVLERVFSRSDAVADRDVVYGDAIAFWEGAEKYVKSPTSVDGLAKGPTYRHGASFVRREIHKKYKFDLSKSDKLGFALDYEQIYRMYKAGCRFSRVDVPVVKYEIRGASTVSPFKCTYYNYLITHDMKCNAATKLLLAWLTLWRGGMSVLKRLCGL